MGGSHPKELLLHKRNNRRKRRGKGRLRESGGAPLYKQTKRGQWPKGQEVLPMGRGGMNGKVFGKKLLKEKRWESKKPSAAFVS